MFFCNPLLDGLHKNKCLFVCLKLHQAIIEMNYVMRYKDYNLQSVIDLIPNSVPNVTLNAHKSLEWTGDQMQILSKICVPV